MAEDQHFPRTGGSNGTSDSDALIGCGGEAVLSVLKLRHASCLDQNSRNAVIGKLKATTHTNTDDDTRRTGILRDVLFAVGLASLILSGLATLFPWVRMLGVGYRGFAGEGKIVAAGSLLMSLLLCILTSGRQRPMIQSVAAAWGTLVFVWLMHLSWTLSDDPRLLLRVTFWLPLTSILSLLAGICFAALQFPSRRALLTSIVLLWIAVNFLSWRGQAFRLEAQTRSSLVRPYDRP